MATHQSYQPTSQGPQQCFSWPCGFCSDTRHMFRVCQVLDDYLRRGLCTRDSTNRICTPDGVQISPQTAPGRNMMERIDNWHKNRPGGAPRVQTNIVEVRSIPLNTPEPSATITQYTGLPATPDEEELVRLEAVVLANMKRQEEIRKRMANNGKGKDIPSGSLEPSKKPATHTAPQQPTHTKNTPQQQQQY